MSQSAYFQSEKREVDIFGEADIPFPFLFVGGTS